MQEINQKPSNTQAQNPFNVRVTRSAHARGESVYRQSKAYVVTTSGARIVGGQDAPLSAVFALHRNAKAFEAYEREQRTRPRTFRPHLASRPNLRSANQRAA